MSTPWPSADAKADRDLLGSAVRAAGALVAAFYERGAKSWDKQPGNPVSEADLASDALLQQHLKSARPDYGWLSEETVDDRSRFSAKRSFVVDPIDGTRAFVKGRAEFVIAAAVIENALPIAAAIYNPITQELYDAAKGHGARKNGQEIKVNHPDALEAARLMGDPGRLTVLREVCAVAGTVNSAALRLALIAEGVYDGLVSVRGKYDWDVAAGHLIIEEAGGKFTARNGDAIVYDRADPHQPPPLAAGPALHALLLERLKTMEI